MALPSLLEGRLRLPLVAAPMFLASGPELVIACCRAGIVGSFPAKNPRTLDGLDEWLTVIGEGIASPGRRAPAPFAVNLIVHRSNDVVEGELDLCVRHQVPIVITSLGAVSELVDRVHAYGGLVFHDVINLRHAGKAIDAGVDGLIAVAAGAGGHTGRASPFALVNEIRQVFDGTLLLSGAMATGVDIAAAQMMGADLAYLGTRFIGTRECRAQDGYKEMIVESSLSDIVETDRVSGVNASFLAPSLADAGLHEGNGVTAELEIASELADALDEQGEKRAWRDIWSAGQGVGSIKDLPGVDELVSRLEAEYYDACTAQAARVAALAAGQDFSER
ncbi:MAG: nitronate monooxygenase family protein [Pseudomonadota bacterium]|nr:nitronate monooxygenase family protein [Pseudomonadota bacterium]MEC8538610.1 nitronate monooxygenase family protein [Pseudomonadota bacterium]